MQNSQLAACRQQQEQQQADADASKAATSQQAGGMIQSSFKHDQDNAAVTTNTTAAICWAALVTQRIIGGPAYRQGCDCLIGMLHSISTDTISAVNQDCGPYRQASRQRWETGARVICPCIKGTAAVRKGSNLHVHDENREGKTSGMKFRCRI